MECGRLPWMKNNQKLWEITFWPRQKNRIGTVSLCRNFQTNSIKPTQGNKKRFLKTWPGLTEKLINNSCRTVFNSCTTESRTYCPTIHTTKCTQRIIGIHSRDIWKINLSGSTSEGTSQGVVLRNNTTGEPRRNPN